MIDPPKGRRQHVLAITSGSSSDKAEHSANRAPLHDRIANGDLST